MKINSVLLIWIVFASVLYSQDGIKIHVIDSVVVTAEKNQPIPQYSAIATKFYMPLREIPLSIGVVNNSLINNQNNLVLGDALENISGVNTQTGNGVHDYFIIRGLNSLENGLILTEGTPEPEVTYYNLYNVERVEVLKGPGSFLYGSNPLSGTVNLVRKQPVFGKFLNLESVIGQYNLFRNSIDAGYGDQETGLAARLNLLWENAGNYRDDKKNKIFAINPSFNYLVNNDLMLYLNFEYINSEYKPDSGLPLMYDPAQQNFTTLADVERTNSYQTPFDYSDQKIIRLKLYADYNISQNISFHSKLYYSQLDWKSQGTLINGAIPNIEGSADVFRTMSKLDDVRDLFGMQNELQIKFQTGSVRHKLITGVEFNFLNENYTYDIDPFLPTIDLYNPVETAVEEELQFYPYLRGNVSNSVLAPYFIDQITFSEQFQFFAGLRYDIIKFENSAEGYLTDRNYNDFSPMLGLSYSPVKDITMYANLGQAYAPPSSQVVGEQEAERSRQLEIGLKQRYLDGRVNIDLSFYYLKKDNITIPASDGITKQLGDQISKGFETEFRVEPITDWFIFLSYAYTDAELTKFTESVPVGQDDNGMPIYIVFDRSGNKPEFAPEHILNLWTTIEFANSLGIGGGIRYLSEQFINVNNVYKLDNAIILDFIAYYKWDWLKLSVNVNNFAGENYELRGFGATSVIPAAPSSVIGKINLYF